VTAGFATAAVDGLHEQGGKKKIAVEEFEKIKLNGSRIVRMLLPELREHRGQSAVLPRHRLRGDQDARVGRCSDLGEPNHPDSGTGARSDGYLSLPVRYSVWSSDLWEAELWDPIEQI
jgi:hypothetical protein